MDEAQAKRLTRAAFRELDITEAAVKRADPELYRALIRISSRIKQLPGPEEGILRQQAWKKIQRDLPELLNGYSQKLGVEVLTTIKQELVNMEEFARGYIEVPLEVRKGAERLQSKVSVGGFSSGSTGDPNVRQVETPWTYTANVLGDDITVRTGQLAAQTLGKLEVAGSNVRKLLGVGVNDAGEVILLNKSKPQLGGFLVRSVEKAVTQGLLRGDTTDDIAREIISSVGADRAITGGAAKRVRSQAMGIARTMTADASNRVQEAFWQQNAKIQYLDLNGEPREYQVIRGWEVDTSMDGRICEQCAPLSGRMTQERSDLPEFPLHPRCRCRALPVSNTELALRRKEGKGRSSGVELFNEQQLSEKFGRQRGEDFDAFLKRVSGPAARNKGVGPGGRWRVFKTQVKGTDGKRWFRAAHDLGGNRTAAEWLAQASPATQQSFFGQGSDKAGAIRAALFKQKLAKGKTADQALAELLTGSKFERQFIPLSKLNATLPEAERILSPREENILARRQALSRRRSSAKAKP